MVWSFELNSRTWGEASASALEAARESQSVALAERRSLWSGDDDYYVAGDDEFFVDQLLSRIDAYVGLVGQQVSHEFPSASSAQLPEEMLALEDLCRAVGTFFSCVFLLVGDLALRRKEP
ncbi:hypothetical protein CVS53_02713 [Microbacterium oxydans]|nr:hypothetical protein CVS53_02713 [Microbacterium oxydans]